MAAARLQRWGLLISAHKCKIVYKKSDLVLHADYLSRYPKPDKTPVDAEIFNVSQMSTDLVSAQEVAVQTLADPVLRQVLSYVKDGWPEQTEIELRPYAQKYLQMSSENDCILWNSKSSCSSQYAVISAEFTPWHSSRSKSN